MSTFVRLSVLCALATLLAAPLAHSRPAASDATAAAPRLGFYNCYGRGYPMPYHASLQLAAGGRYVYGFADSSYRRFKTTRGSGSFRSAGGRITFSGGPMSKVYGVPKTADKFAWWVNGASVYSFYCYRKA